MIIMALMALNAFKLRLVYTEAVQTAKVYVRESSMVSVYAMLLFGGDIFVNHQRGTIQVNPKLP